jgi:DNA-binding Xre family transcriptional regulator
MTNEEKYLKINKRDIADGIQRMMSKTSDGIKINQKFLSAYANVSEAQISYLKNPKEKKTVTLATFSKLLASQSLTFVEFFKMVEENTFKR